MDMFLHREKEMEMGKRNIIYWLFNKVLSIGLS